MKRMIRYKVKADQAGENQQFVEKVFEALHQASPAGVHYATFKLGDGVSFMHIVSADTDSNSQLTQLPAFQAFQAGIKDRCEEQPVVVDLEEVGSYQVF